MKSKKTIIEHASATLKLEAESILNLIQYLNDDFIRAVHTILQSKGRVIVTGIGKSAIIAQKIVATLNSTGTPSSFMHAADAIHGDLGMIQQDDVVICISKSGNTPEIKLLAPLLKRSGNPLIGIVGQLQSDLAQVADMVLNTSVEKEACPHNLAPTTSTAAQMAIGDALTVALLNERDFKSDDFARFHPGGPLGKRLYLKAGDLAARNERPVIGADATVREVIIEISKNRLGAVAVLDGDVLTGVITDGDIRRMLEKDQDVRGITAADLMNPNPKKVDRNTLAVDALELIRQNNITQLVVTDSDKYFGMVHLHDLLQEGII